MTAPDVSDMGASNVERPTPNVQSKRRSGAESSMPVEKRSKRTVIEPRKGDRRYVRRNKKGEFKKEVNVGRSLAADRRRKSKTRVPKGEGDGGETGKPGILTRIFG